MASSSSSSSLTLLLLALSLYLHLSLSSDLFHSWCKQHGKIYSSEEEKLYRLKVFEENLAFINQHNNMGNSTYTLGLNPYSDLTHQEFKASRLGLNTGATNRGRSQSLMSFGLSMSSSPRVADVPSSIDWRTKGAVTGVKDQSSCGACWAFSSTGAMEGINQIVTGSLVSLSEQELVDCDRSYNSGCGGGLMDYVYEFVIKNNGIDSEEDYPFQGYERTCNKNKVKKHVVTIDGYVDIPANDEDKLLQAVASQPVSVGICGSERGFQSYSKGIFSGPCSTNLDHAVLIVGYGSENGVDYWILKNSWGKSWGMNGYMHMIRNTGNKQGVCGINTLASYPTKTSPNPPSPSPTPTKCSLLTSCGAGETCCCSRRLLGFCFSWKCCGLDSAVCCKDHQYCCPHDYPICDTKTKLCFKRVGNSTMMNGLKKGGGLSSLMEVWNF